MVKEDSTVSDAEARTVFCRIVAFSDDSPFKLKRVPQAASVAGAPKPSEVPERSQHRWYLGKWQRGKRSPMATSQQKHTLLSLPEKPKWLFCELPWSEEDPYVFRFLHSNLLTWHFEGT